MPAPRPPNIGLFEAIYSARSIRRLKPDPVPEELITRILDAAIRAPSGGNAQSWAFVVVRHADLRRQLGVIYRKASDIAEAIYAARGCPAHLSERQYARFMAAGRYLWDHMGEAPVLIVPCSHRATPAGARRAAAPHRRGVGGRGRLCRAHSRCQHLPGGAEHHSGLPRSRARHGNHHEPHPLRGRGQGVARDSGGGLDLGIDADRLAGRQIWTSGPSAAQPGRPRRPLGSRLAL